jgi:uncharacterized protein YjbJ (UPF0337 family)
MNTQNTQTLQNNWSDVKAKIKTRWSKFNDTEIDGFKDNLDKLSAQIQKTYGVAKEQAEKELGEFKHSLGSIKDSAKASLASVSPSMKIDTASAPRTDSQTPEAKDGSMKKVI